MSLAKKVSLLVLLLILFIAYCVYSHVDELMIKDSSPIDTILEVKEKEPIGKEPQVISNILVPEEKKEPTNIKAVENIPEVIVEEKAPIIKDVKKEIETKPIVELKTEKIDFIDNIKVEVSEKNYSLSTKNLIIQKDINQAVKKQRIIFKRLSTQVAKQSFPTIKKISTILHKFKTVRIEVAGHTDAKGAEDVNEWISKQRAKSVRKELIKLGINKNRIKAKGYGESEPIVKNDPQGYSTINRRVEFNIIEE